MFIYRLLVSSLWNGGLICAILLLKSVLRSRVSLRFQYCIWYVLVASLALPFLPLGFWREWGAFSGGKERFLSAYTLPGGDAVMYQGEQWLQDSVELAAQHVTGAELSLLLTALWVVGALIFMGYYGCGIYRLHQIKIHSRTPDREIEQVFQNCCRRYSFPQSVLLRQSRQVDTPISFGWLQPMIVLPKNQTDVLSERELEHILLHELCHIRHGDYFTNYLFCITRGLYWFHPLVWSAFRRVQQDREAYCDWAVLNLLEDESARISYGLTLLRFAAGDRAVLRGANGLCQHTNQLKYRLGQIVSFRRDTARRSLLGRCVAGILTAGCMLQLPLMAACGAAAGEYYVPSERLSVCTGDWEELFAGRQGCAVVYRMNEDRYTVYNEGEITRRVPPCSTVKIYSALNALEQGVITPTDNTLPWDGTEYDFPMWETAHSLSTAMSRSVNWYFQRLDQAVGIGELSRFYSRISYGNAWVGHNPSGYWNGSALKISALEQVQLLVKLYRNDFGFCEENVEAVTDAMLLTTTPDCRLYGKTGTGMVGGANIAGWFVGYAETREDVVFFAVYLCAHEGADGAAAVDVTEKILEKMEI